MTIWVIEWYPLHGLTTDQYLSAPVPVNPNPLHICKAQVSHRLNLKLTFKSSGLVINGSFPHLCLNRALPQAAHFEGQGKEKQHLTKPYTESVRRATGQLDPSASS